MHVVVVAQAIGKLHNVSAVPERTLAIVHEKRDS
jgi:hypothetical protein